MSVITQAFSDAFQLLASGDEETFAAVQATLSTSGLAMLGCIIPGVRISMEALTSRTAQLPGIRLDRPRQVIGKNTVDCMRSGIMFGAAAMIDGMLDRVEEELSYSTTVVATGGMSQFVVPLCRRKITLDKDLLLKGLNILWKKNTR